MTKKDAKENEKLMRKEMLVSINTLVPESTDSESWKNERRDDGREETKNIKRFDWLSVLD